MSGEKWNEICFLLSDNIQTEISESTFEKQVIQALRVLDWKEYTGDLEIRPSLPVGAANRISPDIVVKNSEGRRLFVIEIKQPGISLNSRFQQQLFSYMRQLKLEFGVLIGQGIQIFYDGPLSEQEDPILLETIMFSKDNEKGVKFVELFGKGGFDQEALDSFASSVFKRINREEELQNLTKKIVSESYQEKVSELIKQSLLNEYDGELLDSVLKNLKIEITTKNAQSRQAQLVNPRQKPQSTAKYSKDILPIELSPSSESEFKSKLLVCQKAYITTFYTDGTSKVALWNAQKFRQGSNVLGNLRSRPEFRNGRWQTLGIKKVLVSIEK